MLHLHQNIHAPGVVRMRPNEVTGGIRLGRVSVGGEELFEVTSGDAAGYRVDGALMRLQLPTPVAEGRRYRAARSNGASMCRRTAPAAWGTAIARCTTSATGSPKIGVYDDLRGWDADPYTGGAEFYDSFAEYHVNITVPAGWTVMGTGALQNPGRRFLGADPANGWRRRRPPMR